MLIGAFVADAASMVSALLNNQETPTTIFVNLKGVLPLAHLTTRPVDARRRWRALMYRVYGQSTNRSTPQPLHWIYGADKIKEKIGDGDTFKHPEFFHPPSCPYYSTEMFPGHYGPGQVSPYGEEMLCLVDYMVKSKGEFASPEGFADALLHWAETFGGRPNSCTKQFAERRKAGGKYPKCGADDYQINSVIKAVVITARYYGRPELADKVEQAIRVHQNDDKAVEFGLAAARALERVIIGNEGLKDVASKPSSDDTDNVKAAVSVTTSNKSLAPLDFLKVVADHAKMENPVYASSCALPGAYMFPLFFILSAAEPSYEEALRENIRLGGDNCSRAVFLGALLAASGSAAPKEWQAKVTGLAEFEKMVDVIVPHKG